MKRVALHTLGCKLNFAETSTIGRGFAERGFQVVESGQPADVFVLNTCMVTQRAERDARRCIRRALRTSPNAFVIVVGCYAQLEPEEIASIEGVDAVLGSAEKFHLFDFIADFRKKTYPQIFVSEIGSNAEFHSSFSADVGGRTRAFLKVQDGCDYSCAFCTIPLARGGSRSLSVEDVLWQAQTLAGLGYKEIVLTGVNVGDYGRAMSSSLLNLLRALEHIPGIRRIRVSSIEPNLLSRDLIDFMIGSEKVCNHFHIPLQSGSDAILKRMRRRYLTEQYRETIEYIRSCDPDAGIGADVIVGFPGERDDLFEESYLFLVDVDVSYLHVFTYSERPDTAASTFDGTVEPKVRFKRSEVLRVLGEKKRRAFYSRFVGRTMNVLIEAGTGSQVMSGLTSNYIRVDLDVGQAVVNNVVPVLLTHVGSNACGGRLVVDSEAAHFPRPIRTHPTIPVLQ